MATSPSRPVLSDSEPQVIVSVPCPSCRPCEICQGTRIVLAVMPLAATFGQPMHQLETQVSISVNGQASYKINGHEANEAAYDLVCRLRIGNLN